jgi:hypothetical protein
MNMTRSVIAENARAFVEDIRRRFGGEFLFSAYYELEDPELRPILLLCVTDAAGTKIRPIMQGLALDWKSFVDAIRLKMMIYGELAQLASIGEPEILAFFQRADRKAAVVDPHGAFEELRKRAADAEGFSAENLERFLDRRMEASFRNFGNYWRLMFESYYANRLAWLQRQLLDRMDEGRKDKARVGGIGMPDDEMAKAIGNGAKEIAELVAPLQVLRALRRVIDANLELTEEEQVRIMRGLLDPAKPRQGGPGEEKART